MKFYEPERSVWEQCDLSACCHPSCINFCISSVCFALVAPSGHTKPAFCQGFATGQNLFEKQRSQVCRLKEHNHAADFPHKACFNVAISWSDDPNKRVTRGHAHAPPKMWETPAIQPPVCVFCSAINGCLIFFHRRNSSGRHDVACKII